MRLIDADALKEKKVYSHERHEKIVPVADIDWSPTIAAIPVEWLNKKGDSETLALFSNIYGRGDKDIVHSIHKVLELWRKEQDEQNG